MYSWEIFWKKLCGQDDYGTNHYFDPDLVRRILMNSEMIYMEMYNSFFFSWWKLLKCFRCLTIRMRKKEDKRRGKIEKEISKYTYLSF